MLIFLMVIALTTLFNVMLIDIRFDEIRYLLGTIASTDDVSNTLGIVGRYELIKRRIQFGEENIDNFELEARMQAFSSEKIRQPELESTGKKLLRIPVQVTLNSIRYVLGKPIINPKEDDKIYSVLEIGYFWERIRKYTEALKIYDEVLATTQLTPDIKAAVMVHKSFCYSMIGRYEQSKTIYEKVISEFPATDAGILSWKLLDFLNSMEKGRANVQLQKLPDMEKAKQFYLLMDFRNAIKSFSVFISEEQKSAIVTEARYYKGRSHEELGETEEAMMEYRAVIRMDDTKVLARQANRRMLMLGEFYEQQKNVAEEARHKLELYQDQVFAKNVEKYSAIVSANTLKGELTNGLRSATSRINDSILSMIDHIGNIDSIGKQSADIDRISKIKDDKMSMTGLSSAEIKELKRRQYLAENPFRRPSALKRTIDDYSGELRYVYNKRLRTGIKLSGKMLIEIHVSPQGTITTARVLQSNMGDAQFEQTVLTQIQGWKFKPVPDSLGEVTVNYPFEFFEEQ
jgi:TonB family protein